MASRRGGCNTCPVPGGADDAVVPDDELTAEDRAALGWAVSSDNELTTGLVERVRGGGPGVTHGELAAISAQWQAAGRPPPERHVHRTRLTFEDGTTVIGVSFVADDPYARDEVPSFGLYTDERWSPPWPHAHVDWPDFGLPSSEESFRAALEDVLERARGGEVVEIGCLGGHGRTGTALACLAVLTGTPASEAVAWIRANYWPKAVEMHAQEALVAAFG